MSMEIWNTNLRFNLKNEPQRKAYEYLKSMDRAVFKSYSHVIALALVDYFERYYQNEDDPYMETREKENEFMDRIVKGVEQRIDRTLPLYLAGFTTGSLEVVEAFVAKEGAP